MAGAAADTILFSDRFVLGGGEQPLRVAPALVRVSGELISEVSEQARECWTDPPPPDTTVVDLGDRIVSPAFINGHTHLAMAALRGSAGLAAFGGNVVEELFFRLESRLDLDDIRAFARLGAYESLLAGVGLVWDHYYGGQATAEALCDIGLAGVVAPTLQDLAGPGRQRWEAELEATVGIDSARRYRQAGVFAALGPHATDTVSSRLWRQIRELAQARGLVVHAHVAQSSEEYLRSQERLGCTPLELLVREGLLGEPFRLLLVHGLFLTESDLGLLDPTRHVLGCCPFSQMRFGFPADVGSWTRAGIPWLLGTDCAPCNDSMNLQKELRAVAGFQAHATTFSTHYRRFRATGAAADVRAVADYRAETFAQAAQLQDPARLLGAVWAVPGSLHSRMQCGAVRPGHLANLVVWDPHRCHRLDDDCRSVRWGARALLQQHSAKRGLSGSGQGGNRAPEPSRAANRRLNAGC
jgi:5-methylthioadenosine/S-adenosylhomocysteine deaminase